MLSPYQFNPERKQNLPLEGKMFVDMYVTIEGREESYRVIFNPSQEMILGELLAAIFPPRTPDAKFDFKIDPTPVKIVRPKPL